MALVGLDGAPLSGHNPFARRELSSFPVLEGEQLQNFLSTAEAVLEQRAPMNGQVAFSVHDFCVLANTLKVLLAGTVVDVPTAAPDVSASSAGE
jgi:hypothetical protein